ncbi:MAG: hypothetical protein COY40_02430 [Alphaproteobacteria bacterium CG_4_10_14_0_8_um_filter_53_9]|nr:MAG: hypothetical protein COY40_02430 [Alphaproteobacteria bacterium CG_4_10_14_0_8_um_filter_53_9]
MPKTHILVALVGLLIAPAPSFALINQENAMPIRSEEYKNLHETMKKIYGQALNPWQHAMNEFQGMNMLGNWERKNELLKEIRALKTDAEREVGNLERFMTQSMRTGRAYIDFLHMMADFKALQRQEKAILPLMGVSAFAVQP